MQSGLHLGASSTGAGRRCAGGMEHVMREAISMHSDAQVAWNTASDEAVALRDTQSHSTALNRTQIACTSTQIACTRMHLWKDVPLESVPEERRGGHVDR